MVVNLHSEDEEIDTFKNSDLSTVFIDTDIDDANVVYSDNRRGCFLAIDYLHDLGHKKIAHISGSVNTFTGLKRLDGFKEAMGKKQLNISDHRSEERRVGKEYRSEWARDQCKRESE